MVKESAWGLELYVEMGIQNIEILLFFLTASLASLIDCDRPLSSRSQSSEAPSLSRYAKPAKKPANKHSAGREKIMFLFFNI